MAEELFECPECHEMTLKKLVFKNLTGPKLPREFSYLGLDEVEEYHCDNCGFRGRK